MIGLVTSSSETLDNQEFVKVLTELKLKATIKSIYQIINDSFSDAVVFDKKRTFIWSSFYRREIR